MTVLRTARVRAVKPTWRSWCGARGRDARRVFGWIRAEAILIVLFGATLAVLHFEDTIVKRRIVVDPAKAEAAARYAYTDQISGGASVARPETSQALAGSCHLRPGYAYPFCGIGMLLNGDQTEHGLDFTRAEEISIDFTYRGTGSRLSLALRNFDPRYSRSGRGETDKINEVDLPVHTGRQSLAVRIADFHVPDWWLEERRLAGELARPQFDNIVAVQLETSRNSTLGRHEMRVHQVTITIRVLSAAQLYSVVVLLWILALARLMLERRRGAEAAQREIAERGHRMLDVIPQMVWSANDRGYEYYNRKWADFTGNELGPTSLTKRVDLVHPEDRDRAAKRWKHSLDTGEPYECEYRMRHHSGEYRWVLSRASPDRSGHDGLVIWYGTCTDVHDTVLAAHALDESERLTRGIVNAIPDGVSLLDEEGSCVFVNDAAVVACGASSQDELLGATWSERLPAQLRPDAEAQLQKARSGGMGRVTVLGRDGRWWDTLIAPVFDSAGRVLRLLAISRDFSEQKMAEDRANWTANHDALTKLPNRAALQQRLQRLTDEPDAISRSFALVLLDIDDFKRINDAAGHDAGDALLCAFAERLQEAVRTGDTVARLSGDEFALLLPGISDKSELTIVLDRVLCELRNPCTHAGRVFDCSASIGAGIFGEHGSAPAELLKNVDVALYAAKAAGKGNYQIFRAAFRDEMQKRSSMLSLAKDAIADRRILPFYQPKIDLRTGRIVGFEALLRWRAPNGGIQMPARISAAFEDLTLAAELSDRIIESVIRDIVAWRDRGVDFGHVAINAAAAEFRRGDFAERLLECLRAASLPVSVMQLEVTETVFLGRGAECVERALKTLSSEGMQIALDDFGTGYASLSHLNQFPVNTLKIDRSFVNRVTEAATHAPIIDAVINLGRSLGINVVAEGIETEMQHQLLLAGGCDQGQGFFYSPAVAPRRVPALLRAKEQQLRLAA